MAFRSGLFDDLLPGKLVLADKGYVGDDAIITPIKIPENDHESETDRGCRPFVSGGLCCVLKGFQMLNRSVAP